VQARLVEDHPEQVVGDRLRGAGEEIALDQDPFAGVAVLFLFQEPVDRLAASEPFEAGPDGLEIVADSGREAQDALLAFREGQPRFLGLALAERLPGPIGIRPGSSRREGSGSRP
jgi:hypothetical protein